MTRPLFDDDDGKAEHVSTTDLREYPVKEIRSGLREVITHT